MSIETHRTWQAVAVLLGPDWQWCRPRPSHAHEPVCGWLERQTARLVVHERVRPPVWTVTATVDTRIRETQERIDARDLYGPTESVPPSTTTVSRDDEAPAIAERVRSLLLPTLDDTTHRFERWRRTRLEQVARRRSVVDRLRRTYRPSNIVWLTPGDAPIVTIGRSVTVRIEDDHAITVTCEGVDIETAEQIMTRAGAPRRTFEPAAAAGDGTDVNIHQGGHR